MKNFITFNTFVIVSFFVSIFPRRVALFLGRSAGSLLYIFLPIRKKVVKKNLQIAFPNLNNQEYNKISHGVYRHYGLLIVEFLRQKAFKIDEKIYYIDDKTRKFLQDKQNYIILTAHIGNWEMFIPIISKYKKMIAVVRVQANEGGDKFVRYLRSFQNITLISNKGSKRKMLRGLSEGESLLLASDQNAKSAGTYVDFFGKPASIPKGAAHFHLKTNKKILIGFCILNEKNIYEFKLRELNYKKTSEQKEQLIIQINTEYSKILEEEIKKNPSQYFWFHKKWDKYIYKNERYI